MSLPDPCLWSVCFIKLSPTDPKFFGFAEFLTGLALLVVVWTTVDVRYRFRIRTAPLPIQRLTFWVVAVVGVLALFTDLWRAEGWYVPRGPIPTAVWQALLGALLLAVFLGWALFAFIRPTGFGSRNSTRMLQGLYEAVLRGSELELGTIADEMAGSMAALVREAPNRHEWEASAAKQHKDLPKVKADAHSILLLFGDPRFARAVVLSAPYSALTLFRAMAATKRCPIALRTFAQNFVTEAIREKGSFLFHEEEGYKTGLIGYDKPISSAMFADFDLVEQLDSMLDVDYASRRAWDTDQFGAYCRLLLMAIQAAIRSGRHLTHSAILYRACSEFESLWTETYKLDGVDLGDMKDRAVGKLEHAVELIEKAVAALGEVPVPDWLHKSVRKSDPPGNLYFLLAKAAHHLITAAAVVSKPRYKCWWIQHNTVWGPLFDLPGLKGPASEIVYKRLRRLLHKDITSLDRLGDARVVALMINVLGFAVPREDWRRNSRAIHLVLLGWLKSDFLDFYEKHPTKALACLPEHVTFDTNSRRLLWEQYRGNVAKKKYTYLQL